MCIRDRHEAGQQVVLQRVRRGEPGGVQQLDRIPPGRGPVDGAREQHHQRGAQHGGERGAGLAVRAVAQLVQHGIPRRAGFAAATALGDPAGGARQVVDQVGRGETGQADAGAPGQHVTGLDRSRVLGGTAGHQHRQRGGVERVQCGAVQVVGDLVEPVQHRQDVPGLDQRGGQRRPVGGPGDQVGVVAQQLVDQPVPQPDGRGVPRAEAEDHRNRVGVRAGVQVVQGEPEHQDRLPGPGLPQHHQPTGRDAAVDGHDVGQIAGQVQGLGRGHAPTPVDSGGVVGQLLGQRLPAHRQRERVVHPALFLLAAQPPADHLGEHVGGFGQRVAGRREPPWPDRGGARPDASRPLAPGRAVPGWRVLRSALRSGVLACGVLGCGVLGCGVFGRVRRRGHGTGFGQQAPAVGRGQVQGLGQQPQCADPGVAAPAGLQSADGAHTQVGRLSQLFLAHSRLPPQLTQQRPDLTGHLSASHHGVFAPADSTQPGGHILPVPDLFPWPGRTPSCAHRQRRRRRSVLAARARLIDERANP